MAKTVETTKRFSPRLGKKELDLLTRLSNALAVSGDEQEVRAIVYEELKEFESSMHTDAMGNVIVVREGSGKDRVRVMLAGHMDEVGFMVTKEDGDGLFEFTTIGGSIPVSWSASP